MKSRRPLTLMAGLLVAWAIPFVMGCGGGNPADSMIAAANDTNIKRLASMYSLFHLRNQFKGPKNETELKDFIKSQSADRLAKAGIDISEIDAIFMGERDNEPFKIRYGLDTYIRGPSMPVVFEVVGKDGMRQVGFSNGSMQVVNNTEYESLWAGKRDKEKAAGERE